MKRLFLGLTAVLMAHVGTGCRVPTQRPSIQAGAGTATPVPLELDYEAFDQQPGGGWRKVAESGKHLEAARLIDAYEKNKKGLNGWQRRNLRFHAGQVYAFAGQNEVAIARFKSAVSPDEPEDAPIRWNAYVKATIAFLEGDRQKLTELREEMARGPKLQGEVPNLDVVDRMIANFGSSYSAAYGGDKKTVPE